MSVQRYEVYGANVRRSEVEDGEFVMFEDHAAELAARDAQIARLAEDARILAASRLEHDGPYANNFGIAEIWCEWCGLPSPSLDDLRHSGQCPISIARRIRDDDDVASALAWLEQQKEAAAEEALAKYDKRVERALRSEGSAAYDSGARDGFREGRDFGRKEP